MIESTQQAITVLQDQRLDEVEREGCIHYLQTVGLVQAFKGPGAGLAAMEAASKLLRQVR